MPAKTLIPGDTWVDKHFKKIDTVSAKDGVIGVIVDVRGDAPVLIKQSPMTLLVPFVR